MTLRTARLSLLLAAATLVALPGPVPAEDWQQELQAWKDDRDAKLRRPDGWLTLIGLDWLSPGDNPVGSAPDAVVRLPADRSPELLGSIRVADGRASFVPASGTEVLVDDDPVRAPLDLATDSSESGPTVLRHGSLRFYVIERNGRLAVRIKDADSETLKRFEGLAYYPADARWRVEAQFEAAPPGSTFEVPNALGYLDKMDQLGWASFELDGTTHRLLALDDTGDGRLFFVFGDRTNGRETYGGGRFFYADPPVDGKTTLDFNRAYNPPCVFTVYATCPLPPRQNKLPIRIEAGEKKYAHAVH